MFLWVFFLFPVTNGDLSAKALHCICEVESNCNPSIGCHPDPVTLSCGPYQIKEVYWQDCGKPGKGERERERECVCVRESECEWVYVWVGGCECVCM